MIEADKSKRRISGSKPKVVEHKVIRLNEILQQNKMKALEEELGPNAADAYSIKNESKVT